MPVFDVIELPFCKVILTDTWNTPPHRYFIAYRTQNQFRHVLGLPVIDEFATFSSPIFVSHPQNLGKIYNAGLTLANLRDPEMPLDSGWPPLCIGTESCSEQLSQHWEEELLQAIRSHKVEFEQGDCHMIRHFKWGDISLFATNAPLLPKQLLRVVQPGHSSFRAAFSVGNRIQKAEKGQPIPIKAVSEATFSKIYSAFSEDSIKDVNICI